MLENYAIEFINDKIDIQIFQELCQDTYHKYISEKNLQYNLESIKYLPFIHNFSFPEYGISIEDYKSEVQFYLKLLHHEVDYHYSCVILLPPFGSGCYVDIDDKLFIEKISCLFREEKKLPDSIFDIIHNALCGMISQYLDNQEYCFDFINCTDELSRGFLRERIIRLYMYYTGTKEFIVQWFCNASEKDVFCII